MQADTITSEVITRGDKGKWLPGVSANPGGRPKLTSAMTDCLITHLMHPTRERITPKNNLQAIVCKLVAMAKAGDHASIETIYNRIEGKVVQPVDIEQKIGIVQIVLEASRQRELAQSQGEGQGAMVTHQPATTIADTILDAVASSNGVCAAIDAVIGEPDNGNE